MVQQSQGNLIVTQRMFTSQLAPYNLKFLKSKMADSYYFRNF